MGQSPQPARMEHPTTVTRKSDRELVVTRTFDSPVRAVFEAWTRPELFKQWWAPKSMGAVLSGCEIDARTGGGYRMTFGEPGTDQATFFGQYLEVTPSSRLVWTNDESEAAAVTTVAVHALSQRKLAWGILAEPVDVDVTASRLASRRAVVDEVAGRIDAAVRAGHLPAQDTNLAATALLGALHEALVGPLAAENMDDPGKLRDAVQTVAQLALRAVGVMDARARGLVVQSVLPALPAKMAIGA